MEALDDRGSPTPHRLDRNAAVARVREILHVGTDRSRNLLAGDVRRRERRAEDARVDEDDVDALLADAIGEVGVLLALRVECSNENDGRHCQLPRSWWFGSRPDALISLRPRSDSDRG